MGARIRNALIPLGGYLLLYALATALLVLFWPRPWTLTLVFVVLSGLLLAAWHSKRDLGFYWLAFVLGPSIEMVAVSGGAWSYTTTELVPTWLPFAWGIAVLLAGRVVDLLIGADGARPGGRRRES